jgi:hypothetical protein
MHFQWQFSARILGLCRTVMLYSDQSGFNDNRYVRCEVLTMVLMKSQACQLESVKYITVYHLVWITSQRA